MDLSIILWTGGTLFSLGIFAVKTGTGLGYGRVGRKGTALTLGLYLLLFELISLAAGWLPGLLEPLLRGGPRLHLVMALGMVLWGGYLVLRRGAADAHGSSLPLIIPCPVCLTAMTFSTWTALNSLPLFPWAVGLLLGATFTIMTLVVTAVVRTGRPERSIPSLGLAMIAIGLYFIASLFLPGRIEQAKGVYGSFLKELQATSGSVSGGFPLAAVLAAVLLIGFFVRKGDRE